MGDKGTPPKTGVGLQFFARTKVRPRFAEQTEVRHRFLIESELMYQLLNVSGADADNFLQGQLTQDISGLQHNTALPAAWCTPKGRVVATMKLIRSKDGIDLLLPDAIAATFVQRISIYKLRADVQLEIRPGWHGVAIASASDQQKLADNVLLPDHDNNSCSSDDEQIAIRISTDPVVVEVFAPIEKLKEFDFQNPLDESAWRSILIKTGAVRISAANSEKYTPHMLSLDLAGAVSFEKGCYTGQEIVARTEYRGKSRRRLARYECEAKSIETGDELFHGDVAVGTVVNSSGHDVLAVTPTDTHDKSLTINTAAATRVALPWDG